MSTPRTLISVLALCLALVAAGCGSDGYGGGDAEDDDATTTTAETATSAPVELSGTVNDEGSEDISADGAAASVDIEVDDNYFSPTFIKAAPGAKVTVHLENEGDNTHTFTLDGESVDQTLDPGAETTVTVDVPESGSLRFSCNFHSGMGMQGAFYTA